MIRIIRPDTISFRATVSETAIRERMAQEVLEQIGAVDADGKTLPGISVTVRRGQSRAGGYTIDVTGPMPPRLLLPGGSS
jgi:hypothetical protein